MIQILKAGWLNRAIPGTSAWVVALFGLHVAATPHNSCAQVQRMQSAFPSGTQPFVFAVAQVHSPQTLDESSKARTRLTPIDPRLDAHPVAFGNQLNPVTRPRTANGNSSEQDPGNQQEEIDLTQPPERQFEPTGKIEWIRQRYPDGKVQVEREVAQDADGNYFNHGNWRLFNQTGQVLAEGLFQKGLMEGPWQRWHNANDAAIFTIAPFNQFQSPFLSTATFHRGKLDGVWNIYDQNRRKIMEITYREGQRHGLAIWWFPNGVKMREVAFNQGVIDGPLMEWDQQNKATRNEEYIRGQKVVIDSKQFPNQQKQFEQYFLDPPLELDGLDQWWDAKPAPFKTTGERYAHGPIQLWYENGQPQMSGQFTKGVRDGQFTWWHRNGQKHLQGQFESGTKTGQWIWWHANGFKATQGNYVADAPTGEWVWWTEEGTIASRENLSANNSRTRLLSPPKTGTDGETNPLLPAPQSDGKQPSGGKPGGTEANFEEVQSLESELKIEGSLPPDASEKSGEKTGEKPASDPALKPGNSTEKEPEKASQNPPAGETTPPPAANPNGGSGG